MKAISVGGYVMITLIMLAMTIQVYRFEPVGSAAPSYDVQPALFQWGR
ncbi:MAG: hypothetical protein Q7J24_01905 [Desulfomicrobium sp.]|nr:hypothetical protein [Desulfomicrobium sp.]